MSSFLIGKLITFKHESCNENKAFINVCKDADEFLLDV